MEEAEWAIEVMKELGVPVACTLRMGPTGDMQNISPGECAVRMTKAGKYCPCTKDMHNIPPGECAVRMPKAGKYYPCTRDMHNTPPAECAVRLWQWLLLEPGPFSFNTL